MAAPTHTNEKARALVKDAEATAKKIATAESCTGGMIGAAITDIAGSSAVFDRGFITYSNEAKTELLGVPATLIGEHGAVSAEVAEAMAKGALARSNADVAIAVTGIAGPGGGTAEKPVGLVWFGLATRDGVRSEHHIFAGETRNSVREKSVEQALALLASSI